MSSLKPMSVSRAENLGGSNTQVKHVLTPSSLMADFGGLSQVASRDFSSQDVVIVKTDITLASLLACAENYSQLGSLSNRSNVILLLEDS